MRDTLPVFCLWEKGFGRDYTCKQISLHSGVAYQKRLLPLSDDNQEHLVWAGAYLSPAPYELLPQLFREMVAFIFLQFFRDLLLDINFSARLFRKSGELKKRSGERAQETWGNSIAGKIHSDLFSLMEVQIAGLTSSSPDISWPKSKLGSCLLFWFFFKGIVVALFLWHGVLKYVKKTAISRYGVRQQPYSKSCGSSTCSF